MPTRDFPIIIPELGLPLDEYLFPPSTCNQFYINFSYQKGSYSFQLENTPSAIGTLVERFCHVIEFNQQLNLVDFEYAQLPGIEHEPAFPRLPNSSPSLFILHLI